MYVERKYEYGDMVEVKKYHTYKYGDHRKRAEKREPTREEVQRANRARKEKQLYRIICANFSENDAFVTLTYRGDPENEKAEIKKYLRKMRAEARQLGKEFKYILVTEYTKRGRPHHHIIMNLTDYGVIRKTWKHGAINITPLYPDKDYKKLSEYMLKQEQKKEGANVKGYSGSRNLIIPKPTYRVISAANWRREPKEKKGYYLRKDSVVNGFDLFGYGYQEYILVTIKKEHPLPGRRTLSQHG